MLDRTPGMDSVFLQLKDLAQQGNNPLRVPLNAFVKKVNDLLTSRKNIPEAAGLLRDEQFGLRIKAMGWLLAEQVDMAERIHALELELMDHSTDAKVSTLVANMRFALQAQGEVIETMGNAGVDIAEIDSAPLTQINGITFSQFETILSIGVPNPQAAHLLLGWMHASMDMEVGLLMGDAILNDGVKATANRMDLLNTFLVNASQTYAAGARLLGLIRTTAAPFTIAAEPVPSNWIKGQQRLADQGLGEWLSL